MKHTYITDNSNDVVKGAIFISYPNASAQKYIDDAIIKGAAAIMLPADSNLIIPGNIEVIKSENIMRDSAKLASTFYPRRPAHICAITGTKGKTSIVSFVKQIMESVGKRCATIGTLGLAYDDKIVEGSNTTPYPIALFKQIDSVAALGIDYLAIEASSHGIVQNRMDSLEFDSVGFSNLSRDHLDYHKTMPEYFAAKAKLFSDFKYKTSVINADDEWSKKLPVDISIGRSGNDIKIIDINPLPHGQTATLEYFGKQISVETSLIGEFQIYNALMAIGLVIGMGIHTDDLDIVKIFKTLRAPKGRAEFIAKTKSGGTVYVDYAHTPASLEQIIVALRKHTNKKLHVLFGCGGDRDNGKRPIMGEIASRLCDNVIVTDDNPRTEDAANIRAQIMVSCEKGIEIGDRETAIKFAVENLSDGDILILAGKGHEDYQIIGREKIHFDDAEVVRKITA